MCSVLSTEIDFCYVLKRRALGFNPVAVTGHSEPPPTFSHRHPFCSACSGVYSVHRLAYYIVGLLGLLLNFAPMIGRYPWLMCLTFH